MEKVSVIIPTFNRFKYLLNTIESVKNQTYTNLEIIVINDRSSQPEYYNYDWKANNILLFGSEGSGMHQHTSKYADFLVKIEINKKIDSLNISNSAAIVFHHLSYLKKNS